MGKDVFTFVKLCETIEAGFDGGTKPLEDALDEALAKIAAAAAATGGKATLRLTISIKPKARDQLIIAADINTKIPEPSALPILAYVDRRGQLVTEDPDQGRLALETVEPIDRRRAAGGDPE